MLTMLQYCDERDISLYNDKQLSHCLMTLSKMILLQFTDEEAEAKKEYLFPQLGLCLISDVM